jgi:4-hydroxybenzoyl-CoA thioesterase
MVFTHKLRVAFDDVDYAGIVYYPRFFHYFHLAFEELLFSALADRGGYRALLDERRIGFPAVHSEADYKKPLRFGDWMIIEVHAEHVGAKSITLRYTVIAHESGEVCAEGRVTSAVVDLTVFRAVNIPDDLRTLFESLR